MADANLADPTRRRILVEFLDGPAYPSDLADTFGASRANLSNHLTCLRDCGLVTATAEGRRVEAADRIQALVREGRCEGFGSVVLDYDDHSLAVYWKATLPEEMEGSRPRAAAPGRH